MKYTASPNHLAPFDGWVVVKDHPSNPEFIKKFKGTDAELHAKMLAVLLSME